MAAARTATSSRRRGRAARRRPLRRVARALRRRRPLLGAAAGRRAQVDRVRTTPLAYEDRLLLSLRIERLKNPRAHSQHPPQPLPARAAALDRRSQRRRRPACDAAHALHLRRSARRAAADARGQLPPPSRAQRRSAGAIRLKRVDLLNAERAAAGDPAVSLSDSLIHSVHQESTSMKTSCCRP